MEFFIRHKAIVTLISSFIFCTVSLSVQSSTFTLSLEGLGSLFLMPFQKSYNFVQKGAQVMWAGFTELDDLREELNQAHVKLQEYEAATEDLTEIRKENERLRLLLGFNEKIVYKSIPAQIISKDPDNWFRTIVINKGSDDGIRPNMPVVAFTGEKKAVVGKIIEVRGSLSRVQPLISPTMKVGVRLQSSRYPGLMEGYSLNSGLCIVDYINKSAFLQKGDHVITSGQGGIFPPGLLVGTIEDSITMDSSAFKQALVRPLIDYNHVEEVFVILKIPDLDLIELIERH
ncbi:MAG: rod shape-determining protein MreC [Spirochaetes bacterium]|nr:rod shape-determining protein MreC [Spirochaetota bacterium]MBN2770661.1 rod shape-determining protein MreC [Spirochaetota bacterium]HRX15393.1 rod shape-determining protein MreC [Spirochaetota bacterium]